MNNRIPWAPRPPLILTVFLCALAGCGRPAFPQKLFTIEAPDADYPVMLSKTRVGSRTLVRLRISSFDDALQTNSDC